MVFNVKMTLERKARYVAGRHQMELSKDITFASVVSQDSIRMAFLMAALNGLEILSVDISGAYLNAKATEKTLAGKEFGPAKEGWIVILTCTLYGLCSSGKAWRDHIAASLQDGEYKSCKADPDIWMRPKTKARWLQILVLYLGLHG
jgi:Reverse transcriptase (RNA-dependent DNA polymerase)